VSPLPSTEVPQEGKRTLGSSGALWRRAAGREGLVLTPSGLTESSGSASRAEVQGSIILSQRSARCEVVSTIPYVPEIQAFHSAIPRRPCESRASRRRAQRGIARLHLGVNRRGMYTSAGIPGTGIYAVHHIRTSPGEHPQVAGNSGGCLLILFIVLLMLIVAVISKH
jgi:hypothetical protein